MFEYIANMVAADRAASVTRDEAWIDAHRPGAVGAGQAADRRLAAATAAAEAAYCRLACVQRASHRLFEQAVAEWSRAGRPARGEVVVRIVRAARRLSIAYGDGEKEVDGRTAVKDVAWLRHVHNSPTREWLVARTRATVCGPWAADVEAVALAAAADMVEADDRLDQLLLTEEEEWEAHPEWAEKARRR